MSPSRKPSHARASPTKVSRDGLTFTATVPASARAIVEALFFFNPHQHDSAPGIHETIDQLGIPQIVESGDKVWIEVSSGTTQCLFACDPEADGRPVAVVLYGRPDPETLWVSHVAVDPQYGLHNPADHPSLGIMLFNQVAEIARRIRGVRRLRLPYRRDTFVDI